MTSQRLVAREITDVESILHLLCDSECGGRCSICPLTAVNALVARCRELEQTIGVLRKSLGELTSEVYGDPEQGLLGLRARADALAEALRRYGRHGYECERGGSSWARTISDKCTCGLDAALAAARQREKEPCLSSFNPKGD